MCRKIVTGALGVGGVLAVVAIVLAVTVAEGEARSHAFLHLIIAVPLAVMLAGLVGLWAPAPRTAASIWQSIVAALVAVAFIGTTLEAIGGTGYDRFNVAEERRWLAAIHDLALVAGGVLLLAVPLWLATMFILAVHRLVRARSAPSERATDRPARPSTSSA